MPQNIKLNYSRNIECRLLFDNYFDYMLYKGEVYGPDNLDDMAIADFTDWYIENGKLYSSVLWPDAVNNGVKMEDIGLTGPDNGFITFDIDALPNEKILEIMTGTTIEIPSGDTRLFLSPITGNTKNYVYPMFYHEDETDGKYIAFKGGFWQGFYKLYGFDYQTLPNGPDIEWNMFFKIRPRTDYEEESNTLNGNHPDNKGIFFYMGTRAENKFWQFYNTDKEITDQLKEVPDEDNYWINTCESGETYDPNYNPLANLDYLADEEPEEIKEPEYFIDGYVTDDESLYGVFDYTLAYRDSYFDNSEATYFTEVYDIIPHLNLINGYTGETTYHGKYGLEEAQHLWDGKKKKYQTENTCEETKKKKRKKGNGGWGIYDVYTYGYAVDNLCCHTCSCEKEPDVCDVTINEDCCCCNFYYNQCKNYFRDNYYKSFDCAETTRAIEDAYFSKELEIKAENITTSTGYNLIKKGYYEIETDNKFLIFDHTKYGFTTLNWDDSFGKIILYGRNDWGNINLFPLMNRTKTGWTTDTIHEYYEQNTKQYDIYKDIRNNVFALRITDDGAIGYKYGILDCVSGDELTHYSVNEEYSKPGMIKNDVWNDIVVKIRIINPTRFKCDPYKGKRKMRIYIYVNGYLKLISKEMDEFNFKALDDVYQKQEAVPYNISIGGGSQGLLETIYPDFYNRPEYIFPIERDFAGTFIGDIKTFKIYNGSMRYLTIRNYLSKNKFYQRKTTIIK